MPRLSSVSNWNTLLRFRTMLTPRNSNSPSNFWTGFAAPNSLRLKHHERSLWSVLQSSGSSAVSSVPDRDSQARHARCRKLVRSHPQLAIRHVSCYASTGSHRASRYPLRTAGGIICARPRSPRHHPRSSDAAAVSSALFSCMSRGRMKSGYRSRKTLPPSSSTLTEGLFC